MKVSLLRPEDLKLYSISQERKKERKKAKTGKKNLKNKGFVYVNIGFFSYFPPETCNPLE